MKNGSKRMISRIVAFVMLVSCMFTNIISTNAKIADNNSDVVVSGSAVDTQYKWSADDLAIETLAANPSLGGEIFAYNIISGKSKVSGNLKTFADGSAFAQRLQLGGTGSLSKNAGVFTIAAPSAGQLYVYAVTGSNSEGRAVEVYDSSDLLLDSDISGPIEDATTYTYPVFVYDIPAAGTYKVTSTSKGVNFYGMAFVAEGEETTEETTEEPTTETTTVSDTTTEATTAAQGGDADDFGTPAPGKVYSVDFAALNNEGYAVNDKVDGKLFADNMVKVVSTADTAYYHDGSHGLALRNGDQIQVAVAGDATISLSLCQYGYGVDYTVTDAAGNVVGTLAAVGATDGEKVSIDYKGEATTLTLTLAEEKGEAYLHGVTVSNAAAPIGVAENFEFWLDDVATDVDNGDGTVTKTVEPGERKFADSTLTLIGNGDTKYTPELQAGQNIVRAGKTVNAYKAGGRPANCNDIQTIPVAGDGTCVIFTPAATGTFVTYFYSTSFLRVWDFDNDGTRYGYVDSDVSPDSYAFRAEAGHTYVLSTTGKTNNMAYAGFSYIVDEPVTLGVSLNARGVGDYSKTEIYLTDVDLGTVDATVLADTTSVNLAKGHTYVLSTNDGGVRATVAESDRFKAGDEAIVIDLDDIADETLTGTITGTPVGTVEKLTFTNMVNGNVVEAVIDGDTYTAVMKPGNYNTTVVTNNGGVTYDRVCVVEGAESNVNEVWVEVPEEGNGVQYDLPTEVANADTKLTFNNITANNSTSVKGVAGSTIVVPITGTQKVTVAGWYAGTWDINGQNSVTTDSSANAASPTTNSYITDGTETSVTINVTGDGANYLYWIKVEDMVPFKSEISVPGDYDTLTDAVTAIRTMVGRPDGEEGRVTINLTADIQEQVVIDTPYVKINGNGHTISWYYGVGTFYYSIDGNTGLYNERLFRDKYSSNEGNGSLWGGVVIVKGDYFLAENTTFKNTYNYEITDKEKLDFAKTSTSAFPQRNAADITNADVQTQAAKERSNALYVDANYLECYNCNILSSQDTLGANKDTDFVAYFKDCVIGGNTDFICGAGDMVFDNCELQWKSVAKDEAGNNAKLIGPTPREGQYVFRNCDWTVDTTANGPVSGKFGRTWQNNSRSAFINTETNGLISADGWGEMSAGQLATAQFIEYNNYAKGIPMDVTSMGNTNYATGEKLTDEEVKAIVDNFLNDDYTINTLLGGWRPVHYEQKDNEFTTEPSTETTTFLPVPDNGWEYVADNEAADTIYAGGTIYEDNRVKIEASQNLGVKEEGVPVTIEDRTYNKNLTSSGTNTVISVDGGDAKTYRIHHQITAKEDITIKIDNKVGSGKLNTVIKNLVDSGTVNVSGAPVYNAETVVEYNNIEGGDSVFTTFTVELKAGETVYFAGQGTNPAVYGFDIIGGTTFVDNGWDYVADNEEAEIIYAGSTIYEDYRGKIVASQNLGVKEEGVPVTIEDRTYNKNLTSSGTNTVISVDGGDAKTYRIHHQITAKEDITIKIDNKVGSGKLNTVIKNLVDSGTVNVSGAPVYNAETVVEYNNIEGGDSVFTTFTVELKAGETVYFAGQGTNPAVYAFDIVGEDAPEPIETGLWGDVDNDGEVTILDVNLTLQYTLRPATVTGFYAELADVSDNGVIDSEDVALILQKVLDGSFEFPVEKNGKVPPVIETTTETTTEESSETTTDNLEPINVFVVGDSTACHYADTADAGLYIKRVGYGDGFVNYLSDKATVVNLALSGRSSKDFVTYPEYQTLLSSMKAGDYVLIGFGHNDEKITEAARGTTPGGTKETEGSFKNSVYVNYIQPIQAAGATPIIVTPIVRRTDSGTWSDNQLHKANGGDYAQDMIDLGAELGLTVVNATQLTKDLYDTLTPTGSVKLHSWGTSKYTSVDNTHLNNYGAKYVAYLISENIKASDSGLAKYVKDGNEAPTEADINYNPDYVEPSGEDPTDLTSQLWKTTSPWYGSAFGNLGGTAKLFNTDTTTGEIILPPSVAQAVEGIDNFKIQENADGSVNIRAGVPEQELAFGKIEGNGKTDGLIMYYQPISAMGNFEISGTITVNNYLKNSQVAFGAIISDNMKIDTNVSENYKYVSCGPFRLSDVGAVNATTNEPLNGVTSYARVDGQLQLGPRDLTEDLAPGTQIQVSIKKIGNKFTCTYNGTSVQEYTVDMEGDAYAGFFAARCADITVSNIVYNNEVVE